MTPGYCQSHRALAHRDYGRARRWFDQERTFYASTAWRSVRASFLRKNPLCAGCQNNGRLTPARVADHITPIKDGGERFCWSNLQPLCISCHNRKTAKETSMKQKPPVT